MESAATIDEVCEAIRRQPRVRVAGGGSKSALSGSATLPLRGLCGVLEYEPSEFTFTALAGTPVALVQQLLAQHRQYLPFDPPLVEAGATLGGTVAAGLSGAGRYRYGGVRDFLVGIRLANGEGRVIRGGGKVVKNAAGFDLPKLMVGSLGRFGILLELTFKVFPMPAASASLAVDLPGMGTALETMSVLTTSSLELACLDLEPPSRLWLRIEGSQEATPQRLERVRQSLPAGSVVHDVTDDEKVWREVREFAWVPVSHGLVKVPLVPRQIAEMERALSAATVAAPRRYSVAGNVAWLAWPPGAPPAELIAILAAQNLSALAITGNWPNPMLGHRAGEPFARHLLGVFDPEGKFQYPPP